MGGRRPRARSAPARQRPVLPRLQRIRARPDAPPGGAVRRSPADPEPRAVAGRRRRAPPLVRRWPRRRRDNHAVRRRAARRSGQSLPARGTPPARAADVRAGAARRRARGRPRRRRRAPDQPPARRAGVGGALCPAGRRAAGAPQRRRARRARARACMGAAALEPRHGAGRGTRRGGRLEPAPPRGALRPRGRPAAEDGGADPALRAGGAGAARRARGAASPTSRMRAAMPIRPTSTATSAPSPARRQPTTPPACWQMAPGSPAAGSQTSKTSCRVRRSLRS